MVSPRLLMEVTYSIGMLAEASRASEAVIFPASSAAASTRLKVASSALTYFPVMVWALMVSSTIWRPSVVTPAAISSAVASYWDVRITPLAPTPPS